jgi:Fur family ferric uptake transcriptional regulator
LEKNCAASRNTRQKNLILDCLRSSQGGHFTADEITDALKAGGTPVARSTVYRFLSSLEESGDVRKYLTAEGSPVCYQFIGHGGECVEHYHLMCKNCGAIIHFENRELREILRELRDASTGTKLSVDGPRTVFYGSCPTCAELNKEGTI